jgi:AcrR family transcriptional regulator
VSLISFEQHSNELSRSSTLDRVGDTGTMRKYDSTARSVAAQATRQRVLAAAHELFLAKGYGATTLAAIAAKAEVSQQTVYNTVGGKAEVFKAVYDVTLAGDDEPVPLAERPAFRAVLTAPDPRTALAAYAEIGELIWKRVGPLVAVAAASGELRDFAETIESERGTGVNGLVRGLAGRFDLRPGLTVGRAADILWALTAPETIDRLVVRRGWTWEAYRGWLAETAASAIFE